MIRSIEAWEDMQRGYLQPLSGAPRVVKSTEEAERSVTKVEAPVAFVESEHSRDAEGEVLIRQVSERYDGVMLYLLRFRAEAERRKKQWREAAGKTGARE
jgi:hypothetical protein